MFGLFMLWQAIQGFGQNAPTPEQQAEIRKRTFQETVDKFNYIHDTPELIRKAREHNKQYGKKKQEVSVAVAARAIAILAIFIFMAWVLYVTLHTTGQSL